MNTKDSDAIKEALKRFCRTDEAADNLVTYISNLLNTVRIDERKKVINEANKEIVAIRKENALTTESLYGYGCAVNDMNISLKELQSQLNHKDREE